MSCNGCRILRKGCSDDCVLRHCLQGIDNPTAQANATIFAARFFGRACLMSSISAVPKHQRPALFQSLLYEAVGRSLHPVEGAVGLLWTENWHIRQLGVDTILRGGTLCSLPQEVYSEISIPKVFFQGVHPPGDSSSQRDMGRSRRRKMSKRKSFSGADNFSGHNLELCLLTPRLPDTLVSSDEKSSDEEGKLRATTPSEQSQQRRWKVV